MTNELPWTETARAKVNLTLAVLGRRPDGFHDLDSVVAFATIADRVTLDLDAPLAVHVTGPFARAIVGENLVTRTLALLAATAPRLRLGAITIEKHLPVAAGLGGGSADAAAVLRLIRRANAPSEVAIDWPAIALQLGSDVPVCLANAAQRLSARGDVLDPIDDLPALPAVLINPQVPVPADKTRQVFRRLTMATVEQPGAPTTAAGATLDGSHWLTTLRGRRNDLETAAISVIPAISEVLAAARDDQRTLLARLSGAGPTCFALTATPADAVALAETLAQRNPTWWVRPTTLS